MLNKFLIKIYDGKTGEVFYEKTIEEHGGYFARKKAKEEALPLYENKPNVRISSTMIMDESIPFGAGKDKE